MKKINSYNNAIATWLIGANLMIWFAVAAWEDNASIFAIHALILVCAAIILMPLERGVFLLFSVGLILRSIFTVLAWYTAYDDNRRFYIGTNSDASRFWDAAQLSYQDASWSFEDPLFPRLSVLLTKTSEIIDKSHYLATTQSVLIAGSLMVVFAYLFIRRYYNERVATITGLLFALSPTAITYSSGLMRDALIGAFGFVMLWSISLIKNRVSLKNMFVMMSVGVMCLVALAYLRSISLAAFVIAGVIVVISGTPLQPDRMTVNTKLLVLGMLGGLLTFAILDRFDRFDDALKYAIMVRAGEGFTDGMELNPDGLTTRIAEISPILFAVISPTVLMQPIPFFAWEAPAFVGGPPAFMDIVQGFGGLFNQLLFGFYILGARHWLATRDTLGWRLGVVFTLFICTITLVGLGQIRMVMAHVYIFYYAGIAVALDYLLINRSVAIIRSMLTWFGFMIFIYLAYMSYREAIGGFAVFIFASMALAAFILLWIQYPYPRKVKDSDVGAIFARSVNQQIY